MNTSLNIGIILILGLISSVILRKLKSPDVLSYIIVGILIGNSFFNIVNPEIIKYENLLTSLTLGFIAFLIGESLRIKDLKEIGKSGIVVTIVQAIVTTFLVFLGFYLLFYFKIIKINYSFEVSLILGVTATATAPAATFLVLRQYRSKGPLTNYILMAVTLDDAIGIIFFDIAVTIIKSSVNGSKINLLESFYSFSREFLLSLIIGFLLGLLISKMVKYFKSNEEILILSLSFIILGVGLAQQFNLSPLLLNIILGATFANLSIRSENVFRNVENWLPPVFLIFFVISGSTFNLSLIIKNFVFIIIYFILRALGKIYGCFLGAEITKAPVNVKKYLGLSMLSQAGVAIGFSVYIKNLFPQIAYINTIILAGVIIFEIIGPIGVKYSIFKANEYSLKK
ncbi:MAG: cation:proton antiporter [Caldisericia bacterium]